MSGEEDDSEFCVPFAPPVATEADSDDMYSPDRPYLAGFRAAPAPREAGLGLLPTPTCAPLMPHLYPQRHAEPPPQKQTAAPAPCAVAFLNVVLMRRRRASVQTSPIATETKQWFEVVMQLNAGKTQYQLPSTGLRDCEPDTLRAATYRVFTWSSLQPLLRNVRRRVASSRHLESLLVHECSFTGRGHRSGGGGGSGGANITRVFMLPDDGDRGIARYSITEPPGTAWVAESELSGHDDVGKPAAYGVDIAVRTVNLAASLPVKLRFATSEPPLVLYHGTSEDAAETACLPLHAGGGLRMGAKDQMLGPGVYLARLDKALKYAGVDATFAVRAARGAVLRCVVFPGAVLRRTRHDMCCCGCNKPFVDHHGSAAAAAGSDTTFVPDGAVGATMHAEWCVHEPSRVVIDAVLGAVPK